MYAAREYADITMSVMLTYVAIIRMYAGMRTFGFIKFLRMLTVMFTIVMTNSTAAPIRKPFFTDVVTATAGHSESASRKTGFSENMPLKINFLYEVAILLSPS